MCDKNSSYFMSKCSKPKYLQFDHFRDPAFPLPPFLYVHAQSLISLASRLKIPMVIIFLPRHHLPSLLGSQL